MRFGIEFGSYPSDLPPVEVCQQVTERALAAQRNNFDVMPMGIHWPDIDEDLSIAGMLKGRSAA